MHVIVEHRIGHYRPNETSSADESHAVQPLTSTNTQNPLALRRLLEFAVRVPKSVAGGSYGEHDCPHTCELECSHNPFRLRGQSASRRSGANAARERQ
jgi:hypothetical protein